jgi:hypothetical protein
MGSRHRSPQAAPNRAVRRTLAVPSRMLAAGRRRRGGPVQPDPRHNLALEIYRFSPNLDRPAKPCGSVVAEGAGQNQRVRFVEHEPPRLWAPPPIGYFPSRDNIFAIRHRHPGMQLGHHNSPLAGLQAVLEAVQRGLGLLPEGSPLGRCRAPGIGRAQGGQHANMPRPDHTVDAVAFGQTGNQAASCPVLVPFDVHAAPSSVQ